MRILIAESSRTVLAPLEAYLGTHSCSYTAHFVLAQEDFLAEARRYVPEIILADGQLARLDTGNIKDICAANPRGKTVVLSNDLDIGKVRRLLACGVDGCVRPSLDAPVLLKVLKLILAGEKYVPADLIAERPVPTRHRPGYRLPELTPRENDVLAMLMQGCTNKAIAEALGRKEITVTSHLKQIFKKLGADNRTQAALIALDRMRHFDDRD